VITVELNFLRYERPSAFTAACAPVSGAAITAAPGALAPIAVNATAASAGHWSAGGGQAIQATPTQIQLQAQYARVLGTTGFNAMDLLTEKSVDAVRGVPPRGRPV
jgi:hypothetical protein